MAPKVFKLGKSGIRQRLGISAPVAAKAAPVRQDPLGNEIVKLYARGKISANEVGATAGAQCSMSSSSSMNLRRLAKAAPKKLHLTKKGKVVPDARNSSRSLRRTLVADSPLGETYEAEVPMWDHESASQTKGKISLMPIHELLETIVPEGEEAEWATLAADQAGHRLDLEQWGDRVGQPRESMSTCIPLALWGDSANQTNGDSLYLLLFTVLAGACRRRFWICGLSKYNLCQCGCSGRCTFDALWDIIAWMFNALLARRYPRVDHLGNTF